MKKKTSAKTKSKSAKKPKARPSTKAKAKVKKKKTSPKQSSKKSVAKKPKKSAAAKSSKGKLRSGVIAPVNGILLGRVEDYFAHVGVIAITLKAPLAVGNRIQVLGYTTNLEQPVDSLQIDHTVVTQARAQDGVGIKVGGRARVGDHVYLLK